MNNKSKLPTRKELDDKYKWKLEDIYSSDKDWEMDFESVSEMIDGITRFEGILGQSAENIRECFILSDKISQKMSNLFVYANMRKDEDQSVTFFQQLKDRAMSLSTHISAVLSFIQPELLSIDENVLRSFIEETGELKVYKHEIEDMLRQKAHVLSDKEEKLLAMSGEMAETADNVFSIFNTADLKFPEIKDEDGNDIELTHGRYGTFLESKNRDVRKDAFYAMYDTYSKYRNSLGAMLSGSIKTEIFYAKVRNYESCIKAALDADNIPLTVYDKLIETVNNGLPLLWKYLNIKKKAIGLDEMHMYDLYVPYADPPMKNIAYNDAVDMVKKGLAPLGKDYTDLINTAVNDGWIDVYENRGKTTGAYSWGTFPYHPYVLLNYQGNSDDVMTLAHELGHAFHSYYTYKNQPFIYSSYTIFVAEVASTVNEALLVQYLLKNSTDKNEKTYILENFLEAFRGTIFRQVMFAEFEKLTHESFEKGEPLTQEGFSKIHYDLNKKYFGEDIIIDQAIEMEWARIPHFYNAFYVYKYATGFSAAIAIADAILEDKPDAVLNYKRFLSSGSSDYSLELLKRAGVDMSTSKPVEDALSFFNKLLNQYAELTGIE